MPKRGTVVLENYQGDDSVRTDYPPVVVDLDNPLVRRLMQSLIMPWAYPKRLEERQLTY